MRGGLTVRDLRHRHARVRRDHHHLTPSTRRSATFTGASPPRSSAARRANHSTCSCDDHSDRVRGLVRAMLADSTAKDLAHGHTERYLRIALRAHILQSDHG